MLLSSESSLVIETVSHPALKLANSTIEQLFKKRFGNSSHKNKVSVKFVIDKSIEGYYASVSGTTLTFTAETPVTALYGVYDFAEIFLDFMFFEPGHEYICSNRSKVKIPEGRLFSQCKPLLKRRGFIQEFPFSDDSYKLADWMLANKMNYILVWMKYYDQITPELREYFQIRGIEIESGHHNFNYWIPGGKYATSHPEFFAVINGKRIKPSGNQNTFLLSEQLCVTNSRLIDEIVNRMLEYLQVHPEIKTISLVPNDGFGWCECKKCSRYYDKSQKGGTYSVSSHVYKASKIYHDMFSKVAAKLNAVRPDVTLTLCAYVNYTAPAPNFSLKQGIAVHFATYWRCVNHLIYEDCKINSEYMKDLKAWVDVKEGGEINIYEYLMGVNLYISLPLIWHETIFDEIKYYSSNGIDGFMTQFHLTHWTAYGLNFYMAAKAMYGKKRKKAVLDFFTRMFGVEAVVALKLYKKLDILMKSAGPHLITYPRALLKRTNVQDYIDVHETAETLASKCPGNDFARRLVLWTEYMLRFKKLFDKYQAGQAERSEIENFINWAVPLKKDRILVSENVERFCNAWINTIEKGVPWYHHNHEWENKYVHFHDTWLNEK